MTRYSWSPPHRFEHKTERECRNCGLIKVSRHEGDRHWVEFWRDEERIETERTPACTAVEAVAA